jgi:SAM-dependent methyltransferase
MNSLREHDKDGGRMSETYTTEFYREIQAESLGSARAVVPLIMQLIAPRRVIDIGCGDGSWLSVFAQSGVEVQGVDGDYVSRELLLIPPERFIAADLTQPLRFDQRFDLAVSLEVAEHLPAEAAATFITSLTRLAPVVLFSAAVPLQGGNNHLNEQWPEYWALQFRRCGFVPADCLRLRFWDDDQVAWYYAQNMMFFAEPDYLASHPRLTEGFACRETPHALIHPQRFLLAAQAADYHRAYPDPLRLSLRQALAALPELTLRAAGRRFSKARTRFSGLAETFRHGQRQEKRA